jgi:hypothetical protein
MSWNPFTATAVADSSPLGRQFVDGTGPFALTSIGGGYTDAPASAAAATPSPSSTSTDSGTSSTPIRTGGEDTLHVSLWADWLDSSIVAELMAAQQIAREDASERAEDESPTVELAGRMWRVSPYGFKAGESKHSYFPYVLRSEGVTLGLAPDRPGDSNTPNMRIEIGSLAFITGDDLSVMWPALVAQVEKGLRCRITKNRIARVDPCVDLAGVSLTGLMGAFHKRRWISRAKKTASYERFVLAGQSDELNASTYQHGRTETGFSIGRGAISCRVYDKVAEVQRDEIKAAAMANYRWGEVAEVATRVEFQLRRDGLRSFIDRACKAGIETVADWLTARAAVCEYLCTSWLRFSAGDFDARHTERLNALHPDWEAARVAFAEWTGEPTYKAERRAKSVSIEAEALMKQGLGCFTAALVRCGVDLYRMEDRDQVLGWAIGRAFKRFGTDPSVWAAYRDKEERQEASIPADRFFSSLCRELESCRVGVTHPNPATVDLRPFHGGYAAGGPGLGHPPGG